MYILMVKRFIVFLTLFLASIAVFLTVGSCNPSGAPIVNDDGVRIYAMPTVAFTSRVTLEQRADIAIAIEKWNTALYGGIAWSEIPNTTDSLAMSMGRRFRGQCQDVIVFDVVDDTDPRIAQRDASFKTDEHPEIKTLGLTSRSECSLTFVWLVAPRLSNSRDFINVAAHEFGHALGLSHVKDETSLMNELYYSNVVKNCVTRSDVVELCENVGCDNITANVCD